MGRKRRRHINPPKQDPLGDLMADLLGEVRQTLVQGVRQILLPPPPMYQPTSDMLPHNAAPPPQPKPQPQIKEVQVLSVRTEK
jgi:hypothetical protein